MKIKNILRKFCIQEGFRYQVDLDRAFLFSVHHLSHHHGHSAH